MHMSDALVSPPVAIAGVAVAATLLVVAATKVRKSDHPVSVALMGVLGAFVFAAQMLNFSIPGTGSSGHIVGGILLAAFLGPWAAFMVLSCVLVIQCFIFADGGLLVLGCNIVNMAAMTCLVAFPLIFKPIVSKSGLKGWGLSLAAILACTVGLEAGAALVTVETELSGVTLLPIGRFLAFMLPIHLIIGILEGVATAAVLQFVAKYDAQLLSGSAPVVSPEGHSKKKIGGLVGGIAVFAVASVIIGGVVSHYASEDPDGLEWSIGKVSGQEEITNDAPVYKKVQQAQETTALMPNYDNRLAGLAGGVLCLILIGSVCSLLQRRRLKTIVVEKDPNTLT